MIVTSCDVILCTFAACGRLITLLHQNVDRCERFSDLRLIAKLPRSVTEFQPYSDEPLADDDADYVGEDEADQDGLTPEILEARYERRLTVREW